MFDLRNKIALVTGASGGIGAQIATALHSRGATVVLHGTRASKLEALKEEPWRAHGHSYGQPCRPRCCCRSC